jgi:hypothetical protein
MTSKQLPFRAVFTMLLLGLSTPALAQNTAADVFADGKDGAKVHVASNFVCPLRIGLFERDAVGQSDIDTGADFCAYSALDGVYGTITLIPLTGAYDPKASLAQDFAETEQTGGHMISEGSSPVSAKPGAAPLGVYTRSYEKAKLEDLHYRVLFAGAVAGRWAVEATIEFADPRDTPQEKQFLDAVYQAAQNEIAAK